MPTDPSRLAEFRTDLAVLPTNQIVQKHITFGETEILDRAQHFKLRTRVADHFGIHPHRVVVVGSAKLGFSIKPSRRYGIFGDRSDIDVAVVSRDLFRRYWRGLQAFVDDGGYWERRREFERRFFDGWLRPDLMPQGTAHAPTSQWWEFFRTMTSSRDFGGAKITAGVYDDWDCLERYQAKAVQLCQQELNE